MKAKIILNSNLLSKNTILHLHRQYAYQMKAKIILNSYLSSKNTIGYENFLKKDEFQNFLLRFSEKKIFRTQIFQHFFFNTPKILFWNDF